MIRKLASISFILVMVSIMALKHPAFAYCLCEHKIIPLTECRMMQSQEASEQPTCPRCAAKQKEKDSRKEDCTLEIAFDAGDFFWQDTASTPHPPLIFDAPLVVYADAHLPKPLVMDVGNPARQNAPPPFPSLRSFTGVYRL